MSMKNLFLAGAAVTLLATSAMAAEPMKLSASQMDGVTAGLNLDLDLALGITGPVRTRNTTKAVVISESKSNTSNTATIGTSLSSVRTTQGYATNQIDAASLNNNGRVRSGGTLAVSGSVSFSQP